MPAPAETRLAFYDLDGTLVSTNVVTQYAWYARQLPARGQAAWRLASLVVSVPLLLAAEHYSRRLFNLIFYRAYRGLTREYLDALAPRLFEERLRPALYPRAPALLEANRREGFLNVLLTGSLDFAIMPLIAYLGFDDAATNRLEFRSGTATGRIVPPILAGADKVEALLALCRRHGADPAGCRAYSDSLSDLPMLEAVGHPTAANPDRRLRRLALARGWPVVELK